MLQYKLYRKGETTMTYTTKKHRIEIRKVPVVSLLIEDELMALDGPFYDCVSHSDAPLSPSDFGSVAQHTQSDILDDVISSLAEVA